MSCSRGNPYCVGCKEELDQLRTQLTQERARVGKAREAIKDAAQFMRWLAYDSNKYPGTDAGDASRSKLVDMEKAIAQLGDTGGKNG